MASPASPSPSIPLPLREMIAAAFQDSFGKFPVFLRVISVIWLCTLLFVDVPSLVLAENINRSVVAELLKKDDTPAPEEAGQTEIKPKIFNQEDLAKLSREDMRAAVKMEFMIANMVLSLVQVIFMFSFVVAWYRGLLTGEGQGKPIIPRLGVAEWDYAWTSMKVGLFLSPIFVVLVGFAVAGMPEFAAESGGEDIVKAIPLFIIGGLLLIYLQARFAMAYPLTVIGQKEEVLKKSWKMTAPHGLKIMTGGVLVVLPLMLMMSGMIMGVAWLFRTLGLDPVQGLSADGTPFGAHVANFVLRGLGGFFTYAMLAALSAFHARIYAFYVRGGAKD